MQPPPEQTALPSIGATLAGKYRIDRLIGKGGMGAVFAAHHELLGQHVALKLLLDADRDPVSVARFLNEGRAAARIPSEHIARVLDVGILDDRRPFIVMEYLEGKDLSQVLEERGPLAPRDAVDYVLQAMEALAQAHALGILHRDLKPSNLFLAERQDGTRVVKVLDFGISKIIGLAAAAEAAVVTQGLIGSPGYMSPEQVRSSKTVDARSDMWSLGVILYELLSGAMPFEGENVGEILAAILERPPAPLAVRRGDLPAGLIGVVMRCLAREPSRRFADLADLADALLPFGPQASPSIARIRTTMAALAARPIDRGVGSSQGLPRLGEAMADAEAATALAPSRAVQTNDSWTDASPTLAPSPSRATKIFGFAVGLVGVGTLAVVLVTVLRPRVADVAPGSAAAMVASPRPLTVAAPLPPAVTLATPSPAPVPAPQATVTRARPRPPRVTPKTPSAAATAPAIARDRR
jgi:serine/threonine protein kinase